VTDLERAVAIAVAANSPEATLAYANLASAVIALGDLPRGFALQAKGYMAAERFGLAINMRWFQVERVAEDYWQGRWDTAMEGADRFLADVEAGSPHFMEDVCRHVRGLIRLARGELSGALADASSALQLARDASDLQALLPALAFDARVLLATDHLQEANARADEVLAAIAALEMIPTTPDWPGELAIVLHRLGRGAELLRLADRVSTPTPWLRAATAMAAGDFEQAADTYARIRSLPDEAYARLRAAQQHLAAGRRVRGNAQLQQALAFYRQVHAPGYLREADAFITASA
jgi:hypothetical protein